VLNERNGLYDPCDEVVVDVGIGLATFEQNMNFFDNVKSWISAVDVVVVVVVVVVLAIVVRRAVSIGGGW
jgi:hypothetical protein